MPAEPSPFTTRGYEGVVQMKAFDEASSCPCGGAIQQVAVRASPNSCIDIVGQSLHSNGVQLRQVSLGQIDPRHSMADAAGDFV